MSRKALIGCSLLLLAMAGAGLQRTVLQRERALHGSLNRAAAVKVFNSGTGDPITQAASDANRPDESLRELIRLRNQVRELREARSRMEKSQVEHHVLTTQLSNAMRSQVGRAPRIEDGFLMKETWTHAGFHSPDAAIQTFFCALRDGNVQRLMACFAPESVPTDVNGQIQPQLLKELQQIAQIRGYRVAELEIQDERRVKAKVQAAVGGVTTDLRLERAGGGWQIRF